MPTADHQRSIEKHRRSAAGYVATSVPTWPIRMRCIGRLARRARQTELGVGCGTGRSFEPLLRRAGRGGRLIGFEHSPQRHTQAAARTPALAAAGCSVELHCAGGDEVRRGAMPDAMLRHCGHDISRTPAAPDSLISQGLPGARLAVAGMKFLPWCLATRRLDRLEREATQWGMGHADPGVVKEDAC